MELTRLRPTIDIDLAKGKVLDVLYIKQFEHDIKNIQSNLYYNDEEVIVPTTGNSARLNASVDGTVTAYQKTAYIPNSNDENFVWFPLYEELTVLAGTEHCEIEIYRTSTGDNIYTATFDIIVEPSVATSESPRVVSTTELAGTLNSLDSRVTALEQRGAGGTTSAGISAAILAGANGTAGMVSEYEEE